MPLQLCRPQAETGLMIPDSGQESILFENFKVSGYLGDCAEQPGRQSSGKSLRAISTTVELDDP